MCSAGTVHIAASKSNSSQVARRTSTPRAAVSAMNLIASCTAGLMRGLPVHRGERRTHVGEVQRLMVTYRRRLGQGARDGLDGRPTAAGVLAQVLHLRPLQHRRDAARRHAHHRMLARHRQRPQDALDVGRGDGADVHAPELLAARRRPSTPASRAPSSTPRRPSRYPPSRWTRAARLPRTSPRGRGGGSPPVRATARLSAAIRRASASLTSSALPSPMSTRRPWTMSRCTQVREPPSRTRSMRPLPST